MSDKLLQRIFLHPIPPHMLGLFTMKNKVVLLCACALHPDEKHFTDLASAMYFGAFDMLSMPPATTTSLMPSWIDCAANIVAAERKKKHKIMVRKKKCLASRK